MWKRLRDPRAPWPWTLVTVVVIATVFATLVTLVHGVGREDFEFDRGQFAVAFVVGLGISGFARWSARRRLDRDPGT